MSFSSNEYAYAKQFDGNLKAATSRPVPVKVTTRLKVMTEHNAGEILRYTGPAFDAAPAYVFGGGSLPVAPSLQAVGRHYFTW